MSSSNPNSKKVSEILKLKQAVEGADASDVTQADIDSYKTFMEGRNARHQPWFSVLGILVPFLGFVVAVVQLQMANQKASAAKTAAAAAAAAVSQNKSLLAKIDAQQRREATLQRRYHARQWALNQGGKALPIPYVQSSVPDPAIKQDPVELAWAAYFACMRTVRTKNPSSDDEMFRCWCALQRATLGVGAKICKTL